MDLTRYHEDCRIRFASHYAECSICSARKYYGKGIEDSFCDDGLNYLMALNQSFVRLMKWNRERQSNG